MFVDIVSLRIRLHSVISNVARRFGNEDTKTFVNPYADASDDFPEIKKDLIESLIMPKKSVSSTDWKQHWKEQFELETQVIHSPVRTAVKDATKDSVKDSVKVRPNVFNSVLSDMKEIIISDVLSFAARFSTGKRRTRDEKLYDRHTSPDAILHACESLKNKR